MNGVDGWNQSLTRMGRTVIMYPWVDRWRRNRNKSNLERWLSLDVWCELFEIVTELKNKIRLSSQEAIYIFGLEKSKVKLATSQEKEIILGLMVQLQRQLMMCEIIITVFFKKIINMYNWILLSQNFCINSINIIIFTNLQNSLSLFAKTR